MNGFFRCFLNIGTHGTTTYIYNQANTPSLSVSMRIKHLFVFLSLHLKAFSYDKIQAEILYNGGAELIEVYIDGATAGNPGLSGAGIFIKGNGQNLHYSIPLGTMTNHEAEYHALIKGLEICLEKNFSIVSFRTDSQLVDRAIEKEFAKNPDFAPLLGKALELSKQLDLFFMKWIPSSQNKVADELARKAVAQQKADRREP